MNPFLVIVAALVVIASVAIVAVAYLLDKRRELRNEFDATLRELVHYRFRCEAAEAHCLKLLDQRNEARNALLHASEELNRERLLRACAGRGFFRCETGDA